MKRNFFLCASAYLLLAVVTTSSVLTSTLAKYISATDTVSTNARVAAFDVGEVKHSGFGNNEMLYYHKKNPEQMSGYWIEARNNSEVTVRAKLRFYNVLRDNGTIAANYNWTSSPGSRRMLLNNINIFNGSAPTPAIANWASGQVNTAYPRIRNVRTANASGTAYSSTARQYYNATTGVNEGAIVQPGETIRFYFDISHELIRNGTTATNTQTVDDFNGDGTYDAVFRINFDIIATQVD